MKCYSCGKQKNELHTKKSELLDGVVCFMCQSCIDEKFEPRWVIVLAARSKGPNIVKEFIVKRRYIGSEILANELLA
jgi:protein-arginine kinase activator protein McsA